VALSLQHAGFRLALLAALAVVGIPWYLVARTLHDAKPVGDSPVTATGVVWGGRVFTSSAAFSHWLHARGALYRVWGVRHPHALRIVEGEG
jgi:hypothetical protein